MRSKYFGKIFENWKVIDFYLLNHHKTYSEEGKAIDHNAYNYVLRNLKNHEIITISGNTLRRINNKDVQINEVMSNVRKRNRFNNNIKEF